MNKHMKKNLFCLLFLTFCLWGLSGCGQQKQPQPAREETRDLSQGFQPAESKDELSRIFENDRFILYANLSNGEAAVEDKEKGSVWYSNPVDKREDGLASGFNKNALLSVLTVNYNTNQSVEMSCGGYMSSVAKDGMSYRLEEDGSVIFLFDFPNEKFSIPVRYAMEEDHFTVQVLTDGISEYGTNTITTIDVMPFFGAGGRDREGYILVPDGSGALIYYNNERITANTYSKPLYGFDNGTNDKTMGGKAATAYFTLSENQYLPVFGVHQEDRGFLAVITGGEGRASVKANVAGKYTLYNTVWSSYSYRTMGTVRQQQKDGTEKTVNISEKNLEVWEDYEISYYFLEEGKAEYADMAACYRDYLIENKGLVSRVEDGEDIPLYLDLYGYIVKTKSFMGIPKDTKIAMTTAEDANRILDALLEQEVGNVVVKYNYWMKNGYYSKLPVSAKTEKMVASRQELLKLQERLSESGGGLFLSADLINVYRTGSGVSKYDDILQSVANTAQRQYLFSLDSAVIDTRYNPWNLLKPASVQKFHQRLAQNMVKAGYENLALDSIGQMCYSELSGSGMGRSQVTDVIEDTLRTAEETVNELLLSGANDFAAVAAAHIIGTPAKASGYDIEDESVPFYQMVFHGYVSYSLSASNLASNPADMTLKCLEYGASPLYSLVGQNVDELIGSRTDQLYSADYRDWIEDIGRQYSQVNEVLGQVRTSRITEHVILGEDLRKVSYDNGIIIYVNYGEAKAAADGLTLEGKGFTAVRDGKILTQGKAEGSMQ